MFSCGFSVQRFHIYPDRHHELLEWGNEPRKSRDKRDGKTVLRQYGEYD